MILDNIKDYLKNDLISIFPEINKWWINLTIPELIISNWIESYKNQEFICFDTETKGFRDEIIEVWAIVVKNNQIKNKNWKFYDYEYYTEKNWLRKWEMDSFWFFVYPKNPHIPDFITKLTNINMDIIEKWLKPETKDPNRTYPDFISMFNDFIDFINNRPLIAHNAKFDTWIFKWSVKEMFYSEIDKAIKDPNNPLTIDKVKSFFNLKVIDTMSEAKKIFTLNPNLNYKNSTLSDFYWLKSNEWLLHRAIYDVIFTTRNFYWLYETWYKTYWDITNIK